MEGDRSVESGIVHTGAARLKAAVALLSLAGVAASIVALVEYIKYTQGLSTGPSFCNISAHINCEAVNASKWSTFLGIPIAAWGFFFYVSLLGFAVIAGGPRRLVTSTVFGQVIFLAGAAATLVSLTLFGISEFVIGALCLVCMSLYVINFLILAAAMVWGSREGIIKRLAGGLCALKRFAAITASGDVATGGQAARLGLLGIVCTFAIAMALPNLTYWYLSAGKPASVTPSDPVVTWKLSPLVTFDPPGGSGAFGDYEKGPLDAPIQIVEFADFQCPACRRLYTLLEPVLREYEGKYRLIFRNYPLDNSCNTGIPREFHRYACSAAMFSRCAGEQGKFWEAVDYLFTLNSFEGEQPLVEIENEMVSSGAQQLSLDPEALRECIASKRYLSVIEHDIAQGNKVNLTGTPSLWVNGRLVPHPSPESLRKIFSSIIAQPS